MTFTALASILAITNANAAGFQLREQSAAAQGNAFAGATAGAENPSYAFFNAAGLTRQKGVQVNLGGTYIAPAAEAHNISGTGGGGTGEQHNIVHAAVAPNGSMSWQLDDKTVLGLGLNAPFGMITKYDANWAGSAHGNTSRFHSIAVTPMAARKVTDKLSLGAGFVVEHVRARLTSKAGGMYDTAVHGDTTDIGYQLGAMYEFTPDTRIGVGYRSEMKHKIKGQMDSTMAGPAHSFMNQDINCDLDLPATLSLGAYHKLNDKWELMGEYQRTYWSSFDRLDFVGEETGHPSTKSHIISRVYENWRDTNFYALGASYQIDNQWKARFGVAFDQSAVKRADRTPRIPDSDRIWYSFGLSYQYNDNLSFDMAYTYIQAKDAVVNSKENQKFGAATPEVYAEYKNSVKMWGLSLNYKF